MTASDNGQPLVWINLTHLEDEAKRTQVATTALEQGFSHLVLHAAHRDAITSLGKFQALVRQPRQNGPASGSSPSTKGSKSPDSARTKAAGLGDVLVGDDGPRGRWVTIHDKHEEAAVSALAGAEENVVVSATDWKIIPMENLIADFQPTRSNLLAEVRSAQEGLVMLDTLDVGTDGLVLSTDDPQEIIDLAQHLQQRAATTFELQEADIVSIADAGAGERVCIDTCSLLKPGEGMLVGGSSQGLFLIHSESLESPYVNARPFRVNAGAVYAYVMGTQGRTHYLSEVEAGRPLVAVDHQGNARTVTVGRAKVETRPLLLIKARTRDESKATFGVVLQNAETIRFVTPDGGALSVVDAKPGDRVLLARSDSARHFGRAIRENILER